MLGLVPVLSGQSLPAGFVHIDQVAPDVVQELRYATPDNFVGTPIDGYESGRAVLTRAAAEALAAVQSELEAAGFGLKLFDAYRPQQAVAHFVRWARDASADETRSTFYPNLTKRQLFGEGYLALESAHSRGSAVDVTLLRRTAQQGWAPVDMGTPFDFFGPESAPFSESVTAEQRMNRLKLRAIMEKHGFAPSAKEWWHFSLRAEPFPETYFDFPIR